MEKNKHQNKSNIESNKSDVELNKDKIGEESTQNIKKEGHETDKEKILELTLDLKRLQAEFENYIKRSQKENNEFKEYASANIISDLLPVLDSLEQGIKHNTEFTAVYEQLYSILKKNGLEKIIVNVGDEFDHNTMDCLMQESNELLNEGVVAKVLSTGYKLKGKILRTSKISINKLNSESNTKKENGENCN
jgi:molecular chaperone GrpE